MKTLTVKLGFAVLQMPQITDAIRSVPYKRGPKEKVRNSGESEVFALLEPGSSCRQNHPVTDSSGERELPPTRGGMQAEG